MKCIYNRSGECTNLNCGVYRCPLVGHEDMCKHFDENEEKFVLTPKGCFMVALSDSKVILSQDLVDEIWDNFCRYMKRMGYVEEEG